MKADLFSVLLFFGIVLSGIALDIFAHRKNREISMKNAALWTGIWFFLAMVWYGYLYVSWGPESAKLYLIGYLLEESLSVDNLLVFVAIFLSFGIQSHAQHRVLHYGILGAIFLRLLFVGLGTALFQLSVWVEVGFGVVVLWSAYGMFKGLKKDDTEKVDYSKHWSVRWASSIAPVVPQLFGDRFFVSRKQVERELNHAVLAGLPHSKKYITPMFLCLVCVEAADLLFAFDSVPAVIAVTREPFLVYSAMIFAISGLRALYFLLAAARLSLRFLDQAVVTLLVFIGAKLLLGAFEPVLGSTLIHISPDASLTIVVSILGLGIFASLLFPAKSSGKASSKI